MQTNQIKKFAVEARTKLREGIRAKIKTLGFNDRGEVPENLRPRPMQGGCLLPNGDRETEGYLRRWNALYSRVRQKGLSEVYEEAAYTWFNRLVAIRILQNQEESLCEGVLDFVDAARTPRIVDEARMGRLPQMPEAQRQQLMALLDDDTKVTEQFAVLIAAWCHQNPILNACFGGMDDYTALLLPINILAENGFVDMLNHTDYITEADWRTTELIGWLYQFYISERKDEVFAKKGKVEADEIPAATQIFTPNWIVKYMVQNTVGRIYLDNNPYATNLKRNWKYLVESDEARNQSACRYEQLEDLRVADLACGSGHILGECFDLLFDLYTLEGYTRSEAIENIFRHNLLGIDLDTRARQLATFALMLKACQRDVSFADAHCLPQVLSMPQPYDEAKDGPLEGWLHHFFQGEETRTMVAELREAYRLMRDADSLGSIMKFDISPSTRLLIKQTVEYWDGEDFVPEPITAQLPAMRLLLALTEQYHALVMNPPYMGGGNMNATLSEYVKTHYVMGKADLFSVFMLLSEDRLAEGGRYGMINMQSWMFLSSFEALRNHVLEEQTIENMLHLGPRTFDELSGEVVQNTAFVICKSAPTTDTCGIYFRLVDGKDCADKERMFLAGDGRYSNIPQSNFEKIPGWPIGYWVSEKMIQAFENPQINKVAHPAQGFATGDNNRFLKFVWEIDSNKRNIKWIPCSKGGSYRKWFGNIEYCVDWENDGEELKSFHGAVIRNPQYYRRCLGASWSTIASGKASFRFFDRPWLFESKGSVCFPKEEEQLNNMMGFLNTPLVNHFLKFLAPTLDFHEGPIGRLPFKYEANPNIDSLVSENITISKQDWDAHETSWDFQRNELVAMDEDAYWKMLNDFCNFHGVVIDPAPAEPASLEWRMEAYQRKWATKFMQLHKNEEELNRRFIEIYGLQDELTPDVPLEEITILQQGEVSIEHNVLTWHNDVIIKQLISYAVGVWMGRYRLDKPGLHIAYPEPSADELAPYTYNGETIEIDDDGIMPLMASDCGFADNAVNRLAEFVRQVFGAEAQTENLNYMEQCLGKTLEQYFIKDFWKDHKKMYQNRPIYWLFASKKGAFQCIAYLHRMTPYTCERIRGKYLLPYIDSLRQRIADLAARESALSTAEGRKHSVMPVLRTSPK